MTRDAVIFESVCDILHLKTTAPSKVHFYSFTFLADLMFVSPHD